MKHPTDIVRAIRSHQFRDLVIGIDGLSVVLRLPSGAGHAHVTIVASWGGGWDHVSVSRRNAVPTWALLEAVKRIFWRDNEWAMQLHAPPSKHINCHPHTLHMWRPQQEAIPTPPPAFV